MKERDRANLLANQIRNEQDDNENVDEQIVITKTA